MPSTVIRFVASLLLATGLTRAATLPSGFTEQRVASSIDSPTAMALLPDGRIFVCQQTGALRVVKNGSLLATPFLSLQVDSNGERGLLGVTVDPDFATNQYVYVYYTVPASPRFNRVSRFTANGDVAVVGSEVVLLELNPLTTATNHNGGALHFGIDGKLYIAVGENATPSNSQSKTNLLGKLLRMNADGSIPSDNPFYNTASGNRRLIWALGLRNPFTFSIQPGTGRIFINDVGQDTYEEINPGVEGANYGWPRTEGDFAATGANADLTRPRFFYPHTGAQPSGCAITGGTFYNPAVASFGNGFVDRYFYADFCTGFLRHIAIDGAVDDRIFASGLSNPVDLAVDEKGSLYYLQRGNGGQLWRISSTASLAPQITTQPTSRTVSEGQQVSFTVAGSGQDLTYQWTRNNSNIAGATAATLSISAAALADNGVAFRAKVTNSFGTVTSDPAILSVTPRPSPVPTIATPVVGTLFSGGDTISFSGSAKDGLGSALPASALTWRVDYYTGEAVRPFVQSTSGVSSGSFTVPTVTPYLLTNVFFRVILTAVDAQGLSTTATRDIAPRLSTFTLRTQPLGLQLTLDGPTVTAPVATASVVGLVRPVTAPSPQVQGATRYVFQSWSDGGAAAHDLVVPVTDATYTATYATEHRLTTSAGTGGSISAGGFFTSGSTASVTVAPDAGYDFAGFSGDLSGTLHPQSLVMNGPKSVAASFALKPAYLSLTMGARVDGSSPGQRIWTLNLGNIGSVEARNVRVTGARITAVTGTAAVSVTSALPLGFGNIAAGQTASAQLEMNFPASTPLTRIRIEFTFAGDNVAANTVGYSLFR